jgi:hypothetical protein
LGSINQRPGEALRLSRALLFLALDFC